MTGFIRVNKNHYKSSSHFGRLIPSATGGDRNENKQKYLDMVIEENKKYKASGFYDLVLKRQRKWLEELKIAVGSWKMI